MVATGKEMQIDREKARRNERIKRRLKKAISNKTNRVNRSKTGDALIFIVLAGFGLFSILPLWLVIANAFKPLNELLIYPPTFIVRNPTLDNFNMLFSLITNTWVPLSRYAFNTIFMTVAGTFGRVIVCSLAAYPLAKHKFPGHKAIFQLILVALMFNSIVADVVNYWTMSKLGWLDTYLAIIIPAFADSYGFFLMRQFMTQMPDSVIESAKLDGAGEFRIYWSIMMPNMKPAWLTLSIFAVQSLWNNTGSTYIYKEQLKTLTYAIQQITSGGMVRQGAAAAVRLIMMSVPIIFFIISQSKIIETMSSSGMKE